MAHHCPVLMIQKYVRGYITRCRQKKITNSGMWVTKYCSNIVPSCSMGVGHLRATGMTIVPSTMAAQVTDVVADSSCYSSVCVQAPPHTPQSQEIQIEDAINQVLNTRNSPPMVAATSQRLTEPTMYLQLSNTDEIYCQKSAWKAKYRNNEENLSILKNNPSALKYLKNKRISKDPRQLQVLEMKPEKTFSLNFTGDEIPISNFRLQGCSKIVHRTDAFTDLILRNQDAGIGIREAYNNCHEVCDVSKEEPSKILIDLFLSQRKQIRKERLYNRLFKHISMSCLFSIQQAYEDQWKADNTVQRLEEIHQWKVDRQLIKERCQRVQQARHREMLKMKEEQKKQIQEAVDRNMSKKKKYLEIQKENRNKLLMASCKNDEEAGFVQDFSTRQLSVSRALMRHDKQIVDAKESHSRTESVKAMYTDQQQQLNNIRNYIIQHQTMKQVENSVINNELRTSHLLNRMDSLRISKTRVEKMKLKRFRDPTVHYSLPSITLNDINTKISNDSNSVYQPHVETQEKLSNEKPSLSLP